MEFRDTLQSAARYRHQLEVLHGKVAGSHRLNNLQQGGVSLGRILLDKNHVARSLAKAVQHGEYVLEPGSVRRVMLDKPRDLYSFSALDLVVHGTVARELHERMETWLSSRVYSYRKGRSVRRVMQNLAEYIKAHRKARPDPRTRGIYVLRGDVQSYAPSIPVGPNSRIWSQLRDLLQIDPRDPENAFTWRLLEQVVRPTVRDTQGNERTNWIGVAIGSPVATALCNLYLAPLDRVLEHIEGSWYGRYGDDILFAHPDPEVMRAAVHEIDRTLATLGLSMNPDKLQISFFNGAGRPCPASSSLPGTDAVTYIGCQVDFEGNIGLPPYKVRGLLRDLRARLHRSAQLLPDAPLEDQGHRLCAVVNAALDPRSELANRYAIMLHRVVDNRRQLQQLDYQIALTVVEVLLGKRNVRGFREIPYRRLRESWGLKSLVHARNRGGW